jgi:hypothetical protein
MAGSEIVARGGSCVTHPATAKGIATIKPRLLMLILLFKPREKENSVPIETDRMSSVHML